MTNSIFSDDIIALATRVVTENAALGRKITVAESCTGGLVCAALTEIPGSSAVFARGFVTYSNESKIELLGVASDIIETFGAVSIATVWAMAQGALDKGKADIAVAVSGVAGPDGGSDLKPVGTVAFARALRGQASNQEGDLMKLGDLGRSEIRRQAALKALELLLP